MGFILWKVFSAIPASGCTYGYTVLGVVLFFALLSFLYFKLVFQQLIRKRRLQKTGIPGTALITGVQDTGATFSENPQVKLLVEVKTNLGQKYPATLFVVVSRINPFAYRPGMTIPVKIDPKNEKIMVIDESGF